MSSKELIHLRDRSFKLHIPFSEIEHRVQELGKQLGEDYKGSQPVFISVLNGSFMFTADLMKSLTGMRCELSFVKLASYQGTKSTGKILDLIGLDMDIKDKRVIILEDIVDTGNTLTKFLRVVQSFEPSDVKICSLLLKPHAMIHHLKIDYLGFEVPNDFLVGYGLDYNGLGRNLKDIYKEVNNQE